jgi:hypothetical protein
MLAHRLAEIIPPPVTRFAKPNRPLRWAIGITTAPRETYHLELAVERCIAAGFPPPWIFAEPGEYPSGVWDRVKNLGCRVTHNGDQLCVVPNHVSAVTTLLRSPDTRAFEALLMLEDDTLLTDGTRKYLEEFVLWQSNPAICGPISLYSHSQMAALTPGWHRFTKDLMSAAGLWSPGGFGIWGAQALVFSNPCAQEWMKSRELASHEQSKPCQYGVFADQLISWWCERSGRTIWVHVGTHGESIAAHAGVGPSSVFGTSFVGSEKRWAQTTLSNPTYKPPIRGINPRDNAPVKPPEIIRGADTIDEYEARYAHRFAICQSCPTKRPTSDGFVCGRCSNCNDDTIGQRGRRCPEGRW